MSDFGPEPDLLVLRQGDDTDLVKGEERGRYGAEIERIDGQITIETSPFPLVVIDPQLLREIRDMIERALQFSDPSFTPRRRQSTQADRLYDGL